MYIDGNNRLIDEIDKEINLLSEIRLIGSKNGLRLGSVNTFQVVKKKNQLAIKIISLIN